MQLNGTHVSHLDVKASIPIASLFVSEERRKCQVTINTSQLSCGTVPTIITNEVFFYLQTMNMQIQYTHKILNVDR